MEHTMGLYGDYFEPIKEGKKKIEVRLNDEKRREIKVGDTIKFIKVPEQNEVLKVEVSKLHKYPTFQAMYDEIPFVDLGCEGWTIEEMMEGTYEIYSKEQERKWGTLAIEITVA
ncbi:MULTISPECIES: ASCH domain-containing protein [Salinicoccus]|jgi:ASC-1-like (ASCH) protein|nr:ASCH domain-containing protein [Salinicoccus roseus]